MKSIIRYHEQKERYALSKRLVFQKNHHRSTSIRENEYKWILQSMDYVITHSTLHGVSVYEAYEDGLSMVLHMVDEQKLLSKYLKKVQVRIDNERYLSILDQQLPAFFDAYDPYYRACYCKEDLDYPLLYGLPLHQHMYHKKGIDLISEYMRRFAIEESFLQLYAKDLETFIQYYQQQNGILIQELGCNLCEMVLTQALFVYPFAKGTLMLQRTQAEFMKHKLSQCTHIQMIAKQLFQHYVKMLPEEIRSYMQPYESIFIQNMNIAHQSGNFDAYMIINQDDQMPKLLLHESCDSDQYQDLLDALSNCMHANERVSLILDCSLGYYDYIDLFETELLLQEDYEILFNKIEPYALAILFYEHFEEAHVFHQRISLEVDHLNTIQTHATWEPIFLYYLAHSGPQRKASIMQALNSLCKDIII